MVSHIKKNKLKSFIYLLFITIWITSQVLKGIYTTNIINGYDNNINFIFAINVLLVFSFISAISYKGFKTALILSSLLFSLILFGDIAYGRYYNFPLSFSLIDFISQTFYMNDLGETVNNLTYKKDYLLFLDTLILFILYFYLKDFTFKIKYKIRLPISILFLIIFYNANMAEYEQSYTEKYIYNKKEVIKDLGVFTFHMLDLNTYVSNKVNAIKPISKSELEIIENTNKAESTYNRYTGVLEGKNIVVLQMEAFQGFVINKTFNDIEITPNLNKLIKNNSMYASNFYYETAGGNTVDAELLANTAMLPTYQGSAYYLYPNNFYISMPSLLNNEGYKSYSFHAYEGTFWNRIIMHSTLGFEKFYNVKDFDFDDDDVLGWTLNDEKFLKDSLDKVLDATDSKFYSYMVMLSSHYPYEGFYNGEFTWSLGRTDGEVPIFERYLNSIKYVDYTIGEFIKYLKQKGVYENTVIVILGDHGGLFYDERKDMLEMLNLEESEQQYAKLETVPLIIHSPDLKESILTNKVVGQKDLMATLCNLVGLKVPYTFSRDILNDSYKGIVTKRHGNVYTNDFIFLENEQKFYDYETLKLIEDEELIANYEEKIKESNMLMEASELIYKYDYLRKYEKGMMLNE